MGKCHCWTWLCYPGCGLVTAAYWPRWGGRCVFATLKGTSYPKALNVTLFHPLFAMPWTHGSADEALNGHCLMTLYVKVQKGSWL